MNQRYASPDYDSALVHAFAAGASLTNACRHAGVSEVIGRLRLLDPRFRLAVEQTKFSAARNATSYLVSLKEATQKELSRTLDRQRYADAINQRCLIAALDAVLAKIAIDCIRSRGRIEELGQSVPGNCLINDAPRQPPLPLPPQVPGGPQRLSPIR